MKVPYTPPSYHEEAFNCPLCGAYADQNWNSVRTDSPYVEGIAQLEVARCGHCYQRSIWYDGRLVVPDETTAPPAEPNIPEDVLADYEEARLIVTRSPRGAAALLRLALQRLMPYLGEESGDLNTSIGNLVKKGLPVGVQQALDAVRVIGNGSVHPGQIDLRDDPDTARALFDLMNFIVERMITEPKELERIYGALPQGKLDAIEKRDELKGRLAGAEKPPMKNQPAG